MQVSLNKKQEFQAALGRVIKNLHKACKRSARSVAYETEMSKTTILLAQNGMLDPQISTFCKIAEAYYVPPYKLLEMIYKELSPDWSFLEDNCT